MHKRDRILFFAGNPEGPDEPGGPGFPGAHFGGPHETFTIPLHGGPLHGGPGNFKWFGPRMRRGRRIRRGDVRAAILLLVEEEPRNGYQIMQELESRSGGVWRPSPGSVYPALQLLADEGLLRSEARDGGNIFELTDAGRSHLEENRERFGSPWQQAGAGVPEGMRELGGLLGQVAVAVQQVMHAGTEAQVAAASQVMTETRRSLYRVLADDETPPAT
jgi:DNA-binding PadR family transcriptional regulator